MCGPALRRKSFFFDLSDRSHSSFRKHDAWGGHCPTPFPLRDHQFEGRRALAALGPGPFKTRKRLIRLSDFENGPATYWLQPELVLTALEAAFPNFGRASENHRQPLNVSPRSRAILFERTQS
jgi:hypothetical protein